MKLFDHIEFKYQGEAPEWVEEFIQEKVEDFVERKTEGEVVMGEYVKEKTIKLSDKVKVRTKDAGQSDVHDRYCVNINLGPNRGSEIYALSNHEENGMFSKAQVQCLDSEFCDNNVWERHDSNFKTWKLIHAKEMGYDSIAAANRETKREMANYY